MPLEARKKRQTRKGRFGGAFDNRATQQAIQAKLDAPYEAFDPAEDVDDTEELNAVLLEVASLEGDHNPALEYLPQSIVRKPGTDEHYYCLVAVPANTNLTDVRWLPYGQTKEAMVNVVSHGVNPGSGINQTAGIQAILNNFAGSVLFFPVGTYEVDSLFVKSHTRIILAPGTIIKRRAYDDSGYSFVFHAEGTLDTANAHNLASDSLYNQKNVIALSSSAGLSVGGYAVVRDNTYRNGTAGRNQEIVRIRSITPSGGNFLIHFSARLDGMYTIAQNAQILPLAPALNILIEGNGTIAIPDDGNSGGGGVFFKYAIRSHVQNDVLITGPSSAPGVAMNASANCTANRIAVMDGQKLTESKGYGILIGESSQNCGAYRCYTENVRENPATDGANFVTFDHMVCLNHADDGINTHGTGVRNARISYCTISGMPSYGILTGYSNSPTTDNFVDIIGNTVSNCGSAAISVAGKNPTARGSKVQVKKNRIKNFGYSGIEIISADEVDCTHNIIDGGGSMTSGMGILVINSDDSSICNNRVRNLPNGYGILYRDSNNLEMRRNRFKNIYSWDIIHSPVSIADPVGIVVKDNYSDKSAMLSLNTSVTERSNYRGPSGMTASGPIPIAYGWTPTSNIQSNQRPNGPTPNAPQLSSVDIPVKAGQKVTLNGFLEIGRVSGAANWRGAWAYSLNGGTTWTDIAYGADQSFTGPLVLPPSIYTNGSGATQNVRFGVRFGPTDDLNTTNWRTYSSGGLQAILFP